MNQIKIYRGTSLEQKIKILKNGVPYIPEENDIFRFGVKESENSTRYLIKKEWGAAEVENGVVVIKLLPEDTSKLPVKTYKYDIGLQNEGKYQIIIPYSDFIVRPNITQWEEINND